MRYVICDRAILLSGFLVLTVRTLDIQTLQLISCHICDIDYLVVELDSLPEAEKDMVLCDKVSEVFDRAHTIIRL